VVDTFSIVPVLTEKAVKGACLIEDRKVFIAMFWAWPVGIAGKTCSRSSWTHPLGNTIGRERVIVPGKVPFILCPTL
jgi:hypothetical protein